MTDDLARLESALRATPPRPPAAARERAILAAKEAFDRRHQGTRGGARHKGQVPKRGTSWIWRLVMQMSRPSLAFAGSAAVVVVAGVVSYQILVTPQPLQPAGLAEIERRLPAGDPASIDRTNTADELADAAALPQPAGLAEIERRLPAGDPASIDRRTPPTSLPMPPHCRSRRGWRRLSGVSQPEAPQVSTGRTPPTSLPMMPHCRSR